MGQWSEWTACSVTCGTGWHSRTREVVEAPEQEAACGCTEEADACDEKACEEPAPPPPTPGPTQKPEGLGFKVSGKVLNADDDTAIPGAKVMIGDLSAESDATGSWSIENVPEGSASLFSTKDGWVDTKMQLPEIKGETNDVLVYMSKKLGPKEWKIILTWGKTPLDLDARTEFGDLSDPTTCVVSYQADERSATCPSNGISATLDQDHCFYAEGGKHSCAKDPSWPGGPSHQGKPETTTLKNVDPGKCGTEENDCSIVFHVSNYMVCLAWTADGQMRDPNTSTQPSSCPATAPTKDTGTIADSEAEVRVIHGDKQVAFFEMAKGQGFRKYPGTYEEWWVFSIDVQTETVNECTSGTGACV